MDNINNRSIAFSKLGEFMGQFTTKEIRQKEDVEYNHLFFDDFKEQLIIAEQNNSWFTKEYILYAIMYWAEALDPDHIKKWIQKYRFKKCPPKTVAVIMAGNIPLVGFHDFLCVLITGHSIDVKLSSKDRYLLPVLAKYLEHAHPPFKGRIRFVDNTLEHFDAAIATGRTNTARYFEQYLGKKPNIIRKNRSSVAILTGRETERQLKALGKDIFTYYGLGCRNVAKLFVPKGYNFDLFFKAIYSYHAIINFKKYANNYDYNKAVYLMSVFKIIENGFLILKEDKNYAAPIATVFYEYYDDDTELKRILKTHEDHIQCIVSKKEIPFGKAQQPQLWDYADHIDTVAFLLKI